MKSSSQHPSDRGAKGPGTRPDASRGAGKTPTGEPPVDDRNPNDAWDDDDVPTVMIEEEDEELLEGDEDFLDEDIEDDDEGDDDVPIADEQRQRPGS